MNYYPFHLGDYTAHTAHLELLEDLAYRRMLDAYYLREAPLPSDPGEVARIIRMRKNMAEVEAVLREFFELTESGWSHARCDEEIERMQDKQAKARASAAASVSARRAKVQQPMNDRTTFAQRTLDERSTDVELPTPTPTPTPNDIGARKRASPAKAAQLPADFYPNETGVAYAEKRGVSIAIELQSFRNWHESKGSTLKDWQAGWRTWCDKAVEFGRASTAKPTQPRLTSYDQQRLAVARSIFGTAIEGDSHARPATVIDVTPGSAAPAGFLDD